MDTTTGKTYQGEADDMMRRPVVREEGKRSIAENFHQGRGIDE